MLKYLPAAGYTPARAFICLALQVLLGCLTASCSSGSVFLLGVFVIGLSAIFGLTCLWPLRSIILVSLGLIFGFVWGTIKQDELKPGDNDLSFTKASYVKIIGQVQEVKERLCDTDSTFVMVVQPKSLVLPYSCVLNGKVLVECSVLDKDNFRRPYGGEMLEFGGILEIPRVRRFSFQFDDYNWLARQGIFCRLKCRPGDVRLLPTASVIDTKSGGQYFASQILNSLDNFRRTIVSTHNRNLGAQLGSLFSSIVLGDRVVAVDSSIKKEFSQVGLAHLLAASGLNLTIIVTVALALGRIMRRGNDRWLSCFISFFCVLSFTMLAGFGPSVNRAAVMCLVALWARLTFVKMNVGVAMAGALLLALISDPLSALDLGLELSYSATLGIVYIYPHLEALLPACCDGKPWPLMRGSLCLLLTVICAQLAVLPIQLNNFRQFSALALPSNLLAEPVIMPLTVIGFVSSLLAGFTSQAEGEMTAKICCLLDGLCYFPLLWLKTLAHFLSQLPAQIVMAPPGVGATIIYYLMFALALMSGRRSIVALVAVFAGCFLLTVALLRSPVLEIYFDKHQAVVNCANNYYVCRGEAKASAYAGFLRRLGVSEKPQPEGDLEYAGIKMHIIGAGRNIVGVDLSRGGELLSVGAAGTDCRIQGRMGMAFKFVGLELTLPLEAHLENGHNASFLKLSVMN